MSINDLIAEIASKGTSEPLARSGVYVIVNTITQRAYVGQTKNFANRCRAHFNALRNGSHSNKALQSDWEKFGAQAFVFHPVLEVDGLSLLAEEARLIRE